MIILSHFFNEKAMDICPHFYGLSSISRFFLYIVVRLIEKMLLLLRKWNTMLSPITHAHKISS